MKSTKLLYDTLKKRFEQVSGKVVFGGFDGAIDVIARPVKSRQRDCTKYFETMAEYKDHIERKVGTSCAIEYKVIDEKIGGNMPNMMLALGKVGIKSVAIGMMGEPIHDLFSKMASFSDLYSYFPIPTTLSLEFNDGKIITSPISEINGDAWNLVKKKVGEDNLKQAASKADAFAILNWSEMLFLHDVWEGLYSEIIDFTKEDAIFFFDIADCSKRSREDLEALIKLLGKFALKRKSYIGLNKNESNILALNLFSKSYKTETFCRELSKSCSGINVIVHNAKESSIFENDSFISVKTIPCKSPKILTGAGDHFNAGFLTGKLMDLDTKDCILLGNTFSAIYIENGHPPSKEDILNYIEKLIA